MARPRLTLDTARKMPYGDLVNAAWALLEPYEAPDMEEPEARDARISRSLDELPDVYAWLKHLEAWFDHWTDFNADQHSRQSLEYKSMRQRRDAMEKAASAAKLRYEGTSRILTQQLGVQESGDMPRRRG